MNELRKKVNYLVHELNSGSYLVKHYIKKLREKYPDITDKDIEGISQGVDKIRGIEDYFYKYCQSREDWNDS